MPAKRAKASATLTRSGSANGSAVAPAPGERPRARRLGRQRQQRRAVVHQRLVGRAGAIPFQQGELGMVQRPALAVAPDPGEFEDPRLAGRQQLLAGELRRGAQVERRARAVGADRLGGEGVQVRLVAGRDLQGRGLDLDEAPRLEPAAHGAR